MTKADMIAQKRASLVEELELYKSERERIIAAYEKWKDVAQLLEDYGLIEYTEQVASGIEFASGYSAAKLSSAQQELDFLKKLSVEF